MWWCPHVYNESKEYREKNWTSKYLRSWTLNSKPNSTICFCGSLFMTSFKDLTLIFYPLVFNTTIEVIMKKKNTNLNNTLLLLFGLFGPKKLWLYNTGVLFGSTLPCLHPCAKWTPCTYWLEVCELDHLWYFVSHDFFANCLN